MGGNRKERGEEREGKRKKRKGKKRREEKEREGCLSIYRCGYITI